MAHRVGADPRVPSWSPDDSGGAGPAGRLPWSAILFIVVGVAGAVALLLFHRHRIRESRRRVEEACIAAERAEVAEREAERIRSHSQSMKDLEAAKDRFYADISHEFRTPLTLILGPLREWVESRDDEVLARRAEIMHRNALRLLRRVNELLDLSKMEYGGMELRPEPVDVAELVREVTDGFISLSERCRVNLGVRVDRQPLVGLMDPDAMEKVVSNLVSNALKFTDAGGKVGVALDRVDSSLVLSVRDTGIGIPGESLDCVFERFHQARDQSPYSSAGTGIGLALVHEYVELMGGSISAESEEGFGSTFTVTIPFEPVPDSLVERHEVTLPGLFASGVNQPVAAALPDGYDPRVGTDDDRPLVLIADDYPDMLEYIGTHLASQFNVALAPDGEAALAKARERRPSLVITDVMMPGMSGVELCAALRSDEELRQVPVILLTARAEEADRIRGLEAGADDYLTKPFSLRELEVRALNLILARRSLREAYARTIRVLPDEIEVRSRDESFVDEVLHLMHGHLGDSYFGTDMLASELGLSRRQVERRVKETLGRTPPELLRGMRMERASQILKARPGTVAEVAYAVGFRSASHFSVAFRKEFGVSPTEYADNAT